MQQFLAPALAFMLAFIFTPLMRRLALRVGAMDHPGGRKIHGHAMPLLGGVAVYLSFWITAALILTFMPGGEKLRGLFLGSSLILALGLYDDIRGLSYKAKFAGQFVAALILLAYNIRIEFITLPFQNMVFLGAFIVPLTLLWVVGVTNAVNLADGVDGLATGICIIAAAVMCALTFENFPLISLLALCLAGAALGFLPHNFAPARIFLGDSGSLFLGFMLAAFSIMNVTKQATFTTLVIPVLILGLPICDTCYAMWRRLRGRRPIFQADNGHIHHRLLNMGLGPRRTVLVLYFSSIYFGAAAIAFERVTLGVSNVYFIPLVFAVFALGLKYMDSVGALLSAAGISLTPGKGKKEATGEEYKKHFPS
ncbi:MAG: MraY family glycosyltransferase [Bacillota bacterium]